MSASVRVTVSLPKELLEASECERKVRGTSRSELFQEAIRLLLKERQRKADIERYIEGYRKYPETDDEAAEGVELAALAWEDLPWEE